MKGQRTKNHFHLTWCCKKCTEQQKSVFGFVMTPSCHQLAYVCWDDSLRTDGVTCILPVRTLVTNHENSWMSNVDLVCVFSTRRSRARNYDAELRRCRPEPTLVEFGDYHPLKAIMVGITPAQLTFPCSLVCRNCSVCIVLSVCIMFWFPPKRRSPLRSGDGHKNTPWGSQRQHLLIFLLLVVCSDGPSQLDAGWDGSPLHVRRSISSRGSDRVTQCLRRGSFTPPIRRLTSRRSAAQLVLLSGSPHTEAHVFVYQDVGRKKREKEEEAVGSDFEPWSSKRGEILSRFTTTEKLSIVSSSQWRPSCFAPIGSRSELLPVLVCLALIHILCLCRIFSWVLIKVRPLLILTVTMNDFLFMSASFIHSWMQKTPNNWIIQCQNQAATELDVKYNLTFLLLQPLEKTQTQNQTTISEAGIT